MRQTFKGFLKAYCAELSGERTASLRRLVRLATGDAPRIAEPLFLLALEQEQLPYLLALSCGTRLEEEYARLETVVGRYGTALDFLESPDAPKRYKDVLAAYRASDDLLAADRRIASLMRTKTLEALKASGLSRYRLCRELNLNMGNVYAYLKGDSSKVSRVTARRIMEYAQAQVAPLRG